jgi:hypothetical protein
VGILDSIVLGCWEGVKNNTESVKDGIAEVIIGKVGPTEGIVLLNVDIIGLVLGLPDCSMLGVAEFFGFGIPEAWKVGLELGPPEP